MVLRGKIKQGEENRSDGWWRRDKKIAKIVIRCHLGPDLKQAQEQGMGISG